MKKRLHSIWILILIITDCAAQDLIINGSFDDVNICSEYLKPCSPEAWRLTSPYLPGFIHLNQNNCVSFIVYSISEQNRRTYLEARLADTLVFGEKYKLSMDVVPDGLIINKIGVCFSDSLIHTKSDIFLSLKPDFEFVDNKKLIQNKGSKYWIHLEKDFIATSKSNFIIIGSFEQDDKRITKKIKGTASTNGICSYYIDNIKLESLNNVHSIEKIQFVKEIIYSQDERHPVPDLLLELPRIKKDRIIDSIVQQISLIDTIQLFDDLLFEFDSYKPSLYLRQKIDSIFSIKGLNIDSIIVIGHTDNIGSKNYNLDLSKKRAEAVANYILDLGYLQNTKINSFGMGSKIPISTNLTPEGRYKNRRVEIIIKHKFAANKQQ